MRMPRRLSEQAGRYALVDGIPFSLPVNSERTPALMAVFPIDAKRAAELLQGNEVHPLRISGTRALLVITVVNYEPGDTTSIFLNLRVADIDACYRKWRDRGATFLTPPIDRGAEIRCYMRDPDGYLIEVGQATGMLSGHLAAKRPEDLPG